MLNAIQNGASLKYTPTVGFVAGGDMVSFPGMIGVAVTDIAKGATGTVAAEGVFALPKKAGEIMAQGVRVYVDGSEVTATAPAADALAAGVTWAAAAKADTTVRVKINA